MWHKKNIEFNFSSKEASEVMQEEYKAVNCYREACNVVESWFTWARILLKSENSEISEHGESFEMGAKKLSKHLTELRVNYLSISN